MPKNQANKINIRIESKLLDKLNVISDCDGRSVNSGILSLAFEHKKDCDEFFNNYGIRERSENSC